MLQPNKILAATRKSPPKMKRRPKHEKQLKALPIVNTEWFYSATCYLIDLVLRPILSCDSSGWYLTTSANRNRCINGMIWNPCVAPKYKPEAN
jgi:hypothetical protein